MTSQINFSESYHGTASLSHDDVITTYERITPEMALEYLKEMPVNRALSDRLVALLSEAAREGKFSSHVAPIHFDKEGRLRNGQHRMKMIVNTGIAQTIEVIRNLGEEEISALDNGKKRSTGDVLAMSGRKNATMLAGALTNMWLYQFGGAMPGMGRNMFTHDNVRGLSNHNIEDYMVEHSGMEGGVQYIVSHPAVRLLGSPSMLGFCYYVICETNPVQGPLFFEILDQQRFDGNDDPAYRLWLRLKKAKDGKAKHYFLTSTEVGALCIKAFNFWCEGTKVKQLRWRKGGDMKIRDDFPRPVAPSSRRGQK